MDDRNSSDSLTELVYCAILVTVGCLVTLVINFFYMKSKLKSVTHKVEWYH